MNTDILALSESLGPVRIRVWLNVGGITLSAHHIRLTY